MMRAAVMSPPTAALMTLRATFSMSSDMSFSARIDALWRDPSGLPLFPFAKGRPRVFGAFWRGSVGMGGNLPFGDAGQDELARLVVSVERGVDHELEQFQLGLRE
jgi:hypothetical protein